MSSHKRANNPFKKGSGPTYQLAKLKALKRSLERDFFGDVTIDYHPTDEENKVGLIIHLYCNFGLMESLFHLNNGNWGSFRDDTAKGIRTSPFQGILAELENANDIQITLKELSIHLKDTSVIISALPNWPVQDNLECILETISANFVHITKGLSEMPYEIHMPIYEEVEKTDAHAGEKKYIKKTDYLEFWGLYFEGNEDCTIYDVTKNLMIGQTSFYLLNL